MNGENSTTPPEQQPGWRFRPESEPMIPHQTQENASPAASSPRISQTLLQDDGHNQQTPTAPSLNNQNTQQPAQVFRFTGDMQAQHLSQPSQFVDNQPSAMSTNGPEIDWSASEFIDHEKGGLWYVALMLATIIIAGGVFLLTHDFFSVFAVIAALIAFGVMAKRKPKTVEYHVGPEGLRANGRIYTYGNFKSFGLQDEGAFSSLVFMPMKRFMLPVYVYFPPQERDKIMDTLSYYIPFSPVTQGTIDKATHRLRF